MKDALVLEQIARDPWTGGVARGGLPVIPISMVLPAADQPHEGQMTWVRGNGTTTASALYVCLVSATGTYSWIEVCHG